MDLMRNTEVHTEIFQLSMQTFYGNVEFKRDLWRKRDWNTVDRLLASVFVCVWTESHWRSQWHTHKLKCVWMSVSCAVCHFWIKFARCDTFMEIEIRPLHFLLPDLMKTLISVTLKFHKKLLFSQIYAKLQQSSRLTSWRLCWIKVTTLGLNLLTAAP